MPCYRPLKGYRSPGGQIKFGRPGAWVDRPTSVSCGNCIGCRNQHALTWATRIMHETQMAEESCFLTTTYDDAHLPSDRSLHVEHAQAFIKALRRRSKPFKYYLCGEYGSTTLRPHYHYCIMGESFATDRTYYRKTKNGDSLYRSETVNAAWPHGTHNLIGELSTQSACYVASYVNKKYRGSYSDMYYRTLFIEDGIATVHQLHPEFATMSRRPGLGKTWFEKYHRDVYPSDQVIINGVPRRPPTFYDNLLKERDPELHKQIKHKRILEGNRHLEDQTAERQATREAVALAKQGPVTRDIQWQL